MSKPEHRIDGGTTYPPVFEVVIHGGTVHVCDTRAGGCAGVHEVVRRAGNRVARRLRRVVGNYSELGPTFWPEAKP